MIFFNYTDVLDNTGKTSNNTKYIINETNKYYKPKNQNKDKSNYDERLRQLERQRREQLEHSDLTRYLLYGRTTINRTRDNSISPNEAYKEGFEEGREQGRIDGSYGNNHGTNYDDSNGYNDYYEKKYQEGYEEGYEEGYYLGQSEYEEEEEEEEEEW